ncbi:site-specific integrase [Candidatus Bathyarchaeota archaeon]|nr:site-specific integrase [Candidatus Bathyarchaeota archaeon]
MAASTMLSSTGGILDKKAGSKNRKSAGSKRPAQPPIKCPECGSLKIWKDGLRYTNPGPVQRYICRNCAYRFSDPRFQHAFNSSDMFQHVQNVLTKKIKRHADLPNPRQVCAALTRGTKNLTKVETRQKWAAGATTKGKLVDFAWQMKKDGLSERTIYTYGKLLEWLIKKGANLADPESIKEILALEEKWSQGTKHQAVQAYSKYVKVNGLDWRKPKYKPNRKKPFIPLEKELDALIASCGRKTSTTLQLLKETGMRIGEALTLEWIDIDQARNALTVNHTEKNGELRQIPVSGKLIAMLNRLPKKHKRVLGNITRSGAGASFYLQRKRAAAKLGNPRIRRISFHTFRHWKATMEYHRTKDILYVMRLLGHKNINTTLLYTQLVTFKSDEWICKRVQTNEEEDALIEAGFNLVRYDLERKEAIYRKRK